VSEKYAPSFAEYMAKFKISVNDLTPENVDDMIEYTQNRKARSEIIKVASTEKYKKAA
jgi:metal-responsive CopG/Arc/MetJ family transcriptional regulator